MSTRRAVITGIGVRAPGSSNAKEFWDLLSTGRTATRKITRFDASRFRSRVVGECDFDPTMEGLTAQEIARMDRATQLSVAATGEALLDAGLPDDRIRPERVAVSVGSAVAAATSLEREYLKLSHQGAMWEVDESQMSEYMFDYLCPAAMPAEIAWKANAQGPVTMVSDGCTSGIDSVSVAADLIIDGRADVVISGATDAPITPIVVACFDAIRATTPYNDSPETASRPFDNSRAGFVLAEGSAILIVEEFEHAVRRGARIYAEITGYATRMNAHHMTGLKTDGREMAEAISKALHMSGRPASNIGYINAHGSGTRQNDRHETAAYKRSLGNHAYNVPISSIKSMIGHSLGAIGSLEIAASLLALQSQTIPPTANLHEADPECDLDYVPLKARQSDFDTVLTVGSGFGGFQSAMVLSSREVT